MTNYRSPGSEIDDAQSIVKRRAAGDLLAPEGKVSVIIDRKDPLAAQGALTVSRRPKPSLRSIRSRRRGCGG